MLLLCVSVGSAMHALSCVPFEPLSHLTHLSISDTARSYRMDFIINFDLLGGLTMDQWLEELDEEVKPNQTDMFVASLIIT